MRRTNILSAFLCTFLVLIVGIFSATDAEARRGKKQPKKPKCESGIINPATDQCWVCSKDSKDTIRLRVEKAKTETNKLAGCNAEMNTSQLQERQKWWSEFHKARVAENACWDPKHSSHETMARRALESANKCDELLKKAGR